jgi:hypothetical protein
MKKKHTYQRHDLVGVAVNATAIRKSLATLYRSLGETSPADWERYAIERSVEQAAAGEGVPAEEFRRSLGVALGASAGTSIAGAMHALGRQQCLARIQVAIDMLSVVANAQ